MIKIAIDAMGGDNAPSEVVKGAVIAAQNKELHIILVGDESKIKQSVPSLPENIEILHTDEFIEMNEEPSAALRKKRQASIIIAAGMLKRKEVDALISAGNTGALLEAAVLYVGRLKEANIKRPAISVVFPSYQKPCILLDAGANPECKPEYLLQFAKMGSTYVKYIVGNDNPKVGLMNIGTEVSKGTAFIKSTYEMLEKSNLNFVGNIEPEDLTMGTVDVAVADGFVGNIILKTAEGTGKLVIDIIKDCIKASPMAKLGAILMSGVFKKIKSKVDHSSHGGALLFGINGICVKAHGKAKANAIVNAVKVAEKLVKEDIIKKIAQDMQED